MKVDFSTAIVGLLIGIPSFIIGWLGYRRSLKVDNSAARQAVVAARGDEVTQIIAGLNQLVDNLQDDNRIWRASLDSVTLRLSDCVKERAEMRRQLDDLLRLHGGPPSA